MSKDKPMTISMESFSDYVDHLKEQSLPISYVGSLKDGEAKLWDARGEFLFTVRIESQSEWDAFNKQLGGINGRR